RQRASVPSQVAVRAAIRDGRRLSRLRTRPESADRHIRRGEGEPAPGVGEWRYVPAAVINAITTTTSMNSTVTTAAKYHTWVSDVAFSASEGSGESPVTRSSCRPNTSDGKHLVHSRGKVVGTDADGARSFGPGFAPSSRV